MSNDGNGTIAFIPANDSTAVSGDSVKMYGTPNTGYTGPYWSGDTAGIVVSGDTATFAMTEDRGITVTFAMIPVIGSIKAHIRRDQYWGVARILDTIWIYSLTSSFGEEGDSSKVFVGADQDFNWLHFQWDADSIGLVVPEGTESKYFRISIRSAFMVISDLPVNHNFYVKTPGGL
jgi:hypothetical protein